MTETHQRWFHNLFQLQKLLAWQIMDKEMCPEPAGWGGFMSLVMSYGVVDLLSSEQAPSSCVQCKYQHGIKWHNWLLSSLYYLSLLKKWGYLTTNWYLNYVYIKDQNIVFVQFGQKHNLLHSIFYKIILLFWCRRRRLRGLETVEIMSRHLRLYSLVRVPSLECRSLSCPLLLRPDSRRVTPGYGGQ